MATATKKPSDRRRRITECTESPELKAFLLDLEEDKSSGGKVFRMKSHDGGIVDVAHIRALHSILRQLILVSFDSSVPDVIMGNLDSIKTEKDIRDAMAKLREWEAKALERVRAPAGGTDLQRIHMYAGSTAAAILSRVLDRFGTKIVSGKGTKRTYKMGDIEYVLTGHQLSTLSWHFAIAGLYTFEDSQTDYIDVQRSLDHMAIKVDHEHFKSTNMKEWRKEVDEHVASKVDDPQCIALINASLDSWAINKGDRRPVQRGGDPADTQGGQMKPFILAHAVPNGETHKANSIWKNAFKVCIIQLETIDALHDTELAKFAREAWEGKKSVAGEPFAYSSKAPIATKSCYWGRTHPLSLIHLDLDGTWEDYIIVIHRCPTHYWSRYLATKLVFAAVDEHFTGYLNRTSKSWANHKTVAPGLDDVAAHALCATSSNSQQRVNLAKEEMKLSDELHTTMHADKKLLVSTFRKIFVDLLRARHEKEKAKKPRGQGSQIQENELAPW